MTILLSAFVAAICLQNPPPVPPRDPVSKPTETTASISGRITDAVTGQPIPDAIVEIGPSFPFTEGRPRAWRGITGAEGKYVIQGLLPGAYRVRAHPGELRATHASAAFASGGASPNRLGETLTLAAGESRTDIDIQLTRAFAIEGRVVDEFGEPMTDVEVHAEFLELAAPLGQSVTTDDRGMFRVFRLIPGTYRVCASPRPFPSAPEGEAASRTRHVTTCHPSAADVVAAGVTITTMDASGIDIQMQPSRALTVSGHVLRESGAPLGQVHVDITREERGRSLGRTVEVKDGAFVAKGLTPGRYQISARTSDKGGEPVEFGVTPLLVDGADISGVVVRVSRGARVKGQIVPEGGPLPPGGVASLRVQTTPTEPWRGSGPRPPQAVLSEDLTFHLQQIHQPSVLGVSGVPDGWVMKSVWYRGEDVTGRPIEFSSSDDPGILRIVLTNRPARLIVRLIDRQGQPVGGRLAVLLSPDPRRRAAVPYIGIGRLQPDGTMHFGVLAPGEYLVTSISAEGLMVRPDVAQLLASARRLTLLDGEIRVLDLTVAKDSPEAER